MAGAGLLASSCVGWALGHCVSCECIEKAEFALLRLFNRRPAVRGLAYCLGVIAERLPGSKRVAMRPVLPCTFSCSNAFTRSTVE